MAQSISQPQGQTKSPEFPKMAAKSRRRILIPLGLLVAGAAASIWYFFSPSQTEPLHLSGRLEGYETDIGAKIGGRVNQVAVREGDAVHQGEVIVKLNDEDIQAQLRGLTAQLAATKQREQQAFLQIGVVQSQIEEAQLNWQQAQGDANGRIFQAQSNVAAAEAQLSQAEAQVKQAQSELDLAKRNRDRYQQLWSQGAAPELQFDQALTTWKSAQDTLEARQATVESFKRQVKAAVGGLVQAQSAGFNPGIRSTQIDALQKQLIVARSQLVAAQADVANAQAAQQQIQSQINYLNVVSPIDGVVVSRSVEPGAVVTTGKTLLTVINPNTVYLRGYIPQGEIGKVRVGQQAKVFLDSAPDQPLSARVAAIDTEASFTPENIYFRNDRVKQVVGVKITIDKPAGFAKPGMPADAEIITESVSR